MATERGLDPSRLPRGATGFRDLRSEPLPLTDAQVFASVCYEAARLVHGRVLEIRRPEVTPDFRTAVIRRGESIAAVLGHMHLPVLAIAQVSADRVIFGDGYGVIFGDGRVCLEEALRSLDAFQVLTSTELNMPISLIDMSGLDRAERRQIAYWKPQTLGELLFNHWD